MQKLSRTLLGATSSGARLARGPGAARCRRCCGAQMGALPAAWGAVTASGRTRPEPPGPCRSTTVGPPGVPGATGATMPGARQVWPWRAGRSRLPGGPSPERPRGAPRQESACLTSSQQGPGPMGCPPTGPQPRPTAAQSTSRRPALAERSRAGPAPQSSTRATADAPYLLYDAATWPETH